MTMARPYEGATPEQLQHHLVREFLGIHTLFRRELANMLRFVTELMTRPELLAGPQSRMYVQQLAQATYHYTQLLHFHHHGETGMLFPALREKGLDDPVIERLNAEHDEIAALIDQLDGTLHSAAVFHPQVVDSDLRCLSDALRNHLAYEEEHVCPLLTRFSQWPMGRYQA